MEATRADGWGGGGTSRALAWLNLGETKGTDERRREEVKDSDRVRKGCQSIARETLESAGIVKGAGRRSFPESEIMWNRIKVK